MLMTLFLTTVHICTVFGIGNMATVISSREVTRDYFGDIFRMRDCEDGVAPKTRCDRGGTRLALEIPGRPCFCQCAPSHFTYRDDKAECVKEIRECYMSVFFRPYAVEAIPLVFLPTSGQLVHPDAHLSLAGRRRPPGSELPRCKATVSQFMTPEGWRTITKEKGGPIFNLFQDGNKTFLQFLGTIHDRKTLQQRLVLVRMFCKIPNYSPFETCVAVRVGWVPGTEPLAASGEENSKSNMIVVGLSLGVLGMVYVLAVLIYLKLRGRVLLKANRAAKGKPDLSTQEQGNSILRTDPSNRLEMYHTNSLSRQKEMADGVRCWKQLSLNEIYNRNWADRPGQMGCEFNVQEFKLRPEHFEPEIMASPPQPVVDYLESLQCSMTYARHRLRMCSRYQPTLLVIPEEDYANSKEKTLEENDKVRRTTPDGDSSSSNASSVDNGSICSVPLMNIQKLPKPPPRKPRRKSLSSDSSASCCRESVNSSETEDEKIQIKCAMDALNDTLEAIEYDIFQQDALGSDEKQQCLASEKTLTMNVVDKNDSSSGKSIATYMNPTPDEESDAKEMDTSTCSSMSVVTVLSKDPKLPPMNKLNFNRIKQANQFHLFEKKPEFKDLALDAGSNESFKISNLKERKETFTAMVAKDSCELFEHPKLNKSMMATENKMVRSIARMFEQSIENNKDMDGNKRTDSDGAEANSFEETINSEIFNRSSTSECDCTDDKPSTSEFSSGGSTVTDMTLDSLDLQHEKTIPITKSSLLEMWLSKLAEGSLRGRDTKRKSKRREGKHNFDHVCRKKHRKSKHTREPCPVHDGEGNSVLVDTYGAETAVSCDVSSYFQALKRDVLREHLMGGWLTQSRDRGHRMPLVNDEDSLVEPSDSGFRSSPNSSAIISNSCGNKTEGPLRTSSPKVVSSETQPETVKRTVSPLT